MAGKMGAVTDNSFYMGAKQSLNVNVAASAALDFKLAGAFSLSMAVDGKTNISYFGGLALDLNLYTSFGLKFDFGASAFAKFEGHAGGTNTFNVTTKEWDGKFQSIRAQKQAAIRAKNAKLKAKNAQLTLSKMNLALRKLTMDLKKSDIDVSNASFFVFSYFFLYESLTNALKSIDFRFSLWQLFLPCGLYERRQDI